MDSDRYKQPHKIIMREGMFYLTSFVDKHGNPRSTVGSPGYANRSECEAYGDRLRDKPDTPDEVFEEIETGDEETGDVVRIPDTAELNIESSAPEVTVTPDTPTPEASDGQDSNPEQTQDPVG